MSPQVLAVLAAVGAAAFVIYLLRRGVLPERFAALWILVSGLLLLLSVFPAILSWAADFLGIAVPSNLLFFAAAVLLLTVSIQLSYEVGRLDAKTRRLAEEVALLRDRIHEVGEPRRDQNREP